MRIRDRLIALATASLAPSRAPARGPVDAEERPAPDGVALGPPSPPQPGLPRQLGELLLQSIHVSRQRLQQTAEALAAIAAAVASTELAVRDLLDPARRSAPGRARADGALTLAILAANA